MHGNYHNICHLINTQQSQFHKCMLFICRLHISMCRFFYRFNLHFTLISIIEMCNLSKFIVSNPTISFKLFHLGLLLWRNKNRVFLQSETSKKNRTWRRNLVWNLKSVKKVCFFQKRSILVRQTFSKVNAMSLCVPFNECISCHILDRFFRWQIFF